jgi:hypothetical protein
VRDVFSQHFRRQIDIALQVMNTVDARECALANQGFKSITINQGGIG